MEESTPLTQEQARELNRSLMEKLLDRAASDPAWKQQLLDDPEAALREANFPETQQIQRMLEQAEARGHIFPTPAADQSFSETYSRVCHLTWVCHWYTMGYWDYG